MISPRDSGRVSSSPRRASPGAWPPPLCSQPRSSRAPPVPVPSAPSRARPSCSSRSTRCARTGSAATATHRPRRRRSTLWRARACCSQDAFSHCPLTLPAHASLFTGLLPPTHGVRDNLGFTLEAKHRTLARRFQEHGYATGGAVSAYVLRGATGIADGFSLVGRRVRGALGSRGDRRPAARRCSRDGGDRALRRSAARPALLRLSPPLRAAHVPTRPPRGMPTTPTPTTGRWPTPTSSSAGCSRGFAARESTTARSWP